LRKILLLTLLCGLFFFWGNNIVALTNPDEVFYVGTAKEMARQGTWMVPYLFGQPQFEKPILTYWLIRAGLILFGDNAFGARFFPALFALFGVLATYWLALLGFGNRRKAFFSAIILMSSFLYVGMARIVLTDMIFSALITVSLAAFFWAYQRPRWRSVGLVLFFVLSALAVLSKGPLGVVIPFAIVLIFLILRREIGFLLCWPTLIGGSLFLLVSLPWYVLILQQYGGDFIQEFYYNDHLRRIVEAEHGSNDTWYFYPLIMFFGLFPWTAFLWGALVAQIRRFLEQGKAAALQHFLFIWMIVVFAIFQAAHSKLISYVLPVFPVLAIMTGDFLDDRLRYRGKKLAPLFLVSVVLLSALPLTMLIGIKAFPAYLPPVNVTSIVVASFIALICGMIFMVRRNKLLWTIYLLGLQAVFVLGLIFYSYPHFADQVMSRNAVDCLKKNYQVEGRVFSTKMMIRGVRYFGGWDMAYWNTNKGEFFSPHPVPDLDSDAKALAFLRSQPVTYGILDKKSWLDLERISNSNGIRAELLRVIGNQYVVSVRTGKWPAF
jgi:4-amino-4-deoxy-L-arabinose transferase-like glycosyltransferase